MIVIYAVYMDVYFAENLMLNMLVLFLTSIVWNKRIRMVRISVAAVAGAALACGMLVVRLCGYRADVLCNLIQGLIVLKIAYRKTTVQELIRGALYFSSISFVFTQLYENIRNKSDKMHGMVLSIGVLLVLGMAITYLKICKRKEEEDVYYDVEILGKGKKVFVKAIYDTGNVLTEPVSGKAVSIIEKSVMEEIWNLEEMQEYKYIPFRSVGKECGILMGMEVDGLLIRRNDECIERYCEVVALYDGQLSSDGRFRMILHQGIV